MLLATSDHPNFGWIINIAMKRVSTAELIRNFSVHGDAALAEPIIVTKNGRDRLVMMSAEQYDKRRHAYDAIRGDQPETTATP